MCNVCGCSHDGHDHIHIILPVKGISSESAASTLEQQLNALEGIHATADYELGCVSLLLHENSRLEQAKQLIIEQGYKL